MKNMTKMASTTEPATGQRNYTDFDLDFCYLSFDAAVSLVVANVIIGLCGFLLNLLVLLAIVLNRKLRTNNANILLGSLSAADLVISVFGQPSFSAQILYTYRMQCLETWAYYAFTTSCSTSFFLSMVFLTMVTIERFIAVQTPVLHRKYLTTKVVHRVVILVLLATIGYGLYSFFERQKRRRFTRAGIFAVFCLTAVIMNICTLVFTRRFLQKRYRSSRNTVERKRLQAKLRQVTLLLLLLIAALLSWFLIIVIVILYFADVLMLAVVYGILTAIFLNSCLNPVAYCLMDPDIRMAMFGLLRKVKLRPKNNAEIRRATRKNGEIHAQPEDTHTPSTSQTILQLPRNNFRVQIQLLVLQAVNGFLNWMQNAATSFRERSHATNNDNVSATASYKSSTNTASVTISSNEDTLN